MKVVGMCFLMLLPTLALAQQHPYYGSVAASVRLTDPVDGSDSLRITVHAGDVITPENVRASIDALYATRHYQYIEVEAAAEESGTALTFRTRPFYFFGGVHLEPANLLDRSLMSFIRVPHGAKFSTAPVDRIEEETRRLLENQGYFNATLRPDFMFDQKNRLVNVALNADVFPRARISGISIEGGEQTFSVVELEKALGIDVGDNFSEDKLESGVARIQQKFTRLGFLNTQIDVQRRYNAATNSVEILARISPGQFAYVNVRTTGGETVTEVSREDLRTLIPIFEEGVVDSDLIEEGKTRLIRFLRQRGYFDVTATWERIDAIQNNAVQITYTVEKGELRRLSEIQFAGATFFTPEQLRQITRIRASGALNPGIFSRDLLETDLESIKALYRNAGFFDVSATSRQEEDAQEQSKSITLTIEIHEGQRYSIARLSFSGVSAIPESELRQKVTVLEGQPYSATDIDAATKNLMSAYHALGYSDVRIFPIREPDGAMNVNITFQVTEGMPYRIGDITIAGNRLTAEKIIRRDSILRAGMPYDDEAILAEQHRLYATGLFNRVQIVTMDQDLGQTRNLMIFVEDANPVLISYGLGYKEFEGPRGTFEISHNNLWGLDRTLSFRLRLGQRERSFQSSYREPHLFNHNIEGFATLLIEKAERRFFNANTVDFSLQTVRRLTPQFNLILTASYQTVNLKDILVNPVASQFPNIGGVIQIARIGSTILRDWRDDALDPHRGSFQTATFQVASTKLGSEVNFTSLFDQWTMYFPQGARVLALSTRVGWKHPFGGDTEVPISERYFAGGSTTLRGFGLDELRAGGGHLLTIGNVEYRVPLLTFKSRGLGAVIVRGISGALFYDTGNVFEKASDFTLADFTNTVGAGLRAQTPLGPVRLDVGVNLRPEDRLRNDGAIERDKRVRFFLTLGNAF
ncbi:MAG TPA: POTRA domain-containing protein [Terriglobia bacterium]|nr:POTRA domain-containing protein [Terriglobia bacterium]